MAENYIVINGKKAELTEEQLKALGIEVPKENPFERVKKKNLFYWMTNKGNVEMGVELEDFQCNGLYAVANYCTDKAIMEQRALHETLDRLLWRYSMEHDRDKINWDDPKNEKWFIIYDHKYGAWNISRNGRYQDLGTPYFSTEATALNAIEEIVKPFMEGSPRL